MNKSLSSFRGIPLYRRIEYYCEVLELSHLLGLVETVLITVGEVESCEPLS